MNGRQKIEAAFSPDGTPEIPVVICYEGLVIRDHWKALTAAPWWYASDPDLDHQLAWRRDASRGLGHEWTRLAFHPSREERKHLRIDVRPGGVFRVNSRTGSEEQLQEPQVSGWSPTGEAASHNPEKLADTREEIDHLIPVQPEPDYDLITQDGRTDLAQRILQDYGRDLYPINYVASPLWQCYTLWGFEGMMEMVVTQPDLVRYACDRLLEGYLQNVRALARLGVAGLWIEECLTDMISPAAFQAINVPLLRRLIGEIHAQKMKAIYYYCGNPAGKWEHILSVGADALSLEEGKKGFMIDIEDVVARVNGRCVVLGNIDAIGILQQASESELRAEIRRQLAAGRRNKSRFILSLGSPATPETPVSRIRRYCDMTREMA